MARSKTLAVIVDASVLNKTILDEPESGAVVAALSRAASRRVGLRVLPLTRYEVGNVLLTFARRNGRDADVDADVDHALALVTEGDHPRDVGAVAAKHRLTYYDAAYLALALDLGKGARLWTFDRKLADAAADEGALITTEEVGAL